MFLNNLMANVQPKSCSFADCFGREERFKNIFADGFRDTGTVVFTFKNDMPGVVFTSSGKMDDPLFVGHRLDGILDDV